ncbi:prolyl oligopeptidase family serine peptidase [Nonomuraea roseoviolacea]|uniref:Dipeptidyl aminopeptidase/acylaminoacyl peptidase n=1 Tax=Nonomuraea roseoviolacea subsp. carminata TaxID=160689 RepID=A0ABT1KFK6_9ACTN|nr:prolyl oligopeptidase family serine peptidase [Nonomuraea roseoviolacea]MCP2352808.1 dipeptidyl aminopeptidase/acylaminoacyl peptidase [Nonomuraea roseoviolacea subsp. carminata]
MSIRPIDVARTDGGPLWVEAVATPAGVEVWWDEPRPHEGGRRCVVRRLPDGSRVDALPAGWNARNRVIEYGGRSWRPLPGGGLVFTNWADQRLYRLDGASQGDDGPVALTPEGPARYADLYLPPGRDEVWAVREIGTERDLVAVPLSGGPVRVIVRAQHFLMCPRLSPGGGHVSWIGWDHPNMPWDGTELCVAPLGADGVAGPHTVVAGGPAESVVQAEWRDEDALYAVTDPTGWWNIHLVSREGGPYRNLTPRAEEFGDAPWKPGASWFAVTDAGLVVVHGTADRWSLSVLDPETGGLRDVGGEATYWGPTVSAAGGMAVAVMATPYTPRQVVLVDLARGAREVMSAPKPLPARELLPDPEAVTIEGVHAHLYPPAGAPAGPAPYVIFVHGGPTGNRPMVLDLEIAYFTSRGLGVAEVNYGGSTGYGRAYRERLRHQWGVVDVEDCAKVARGLVTMGRADAARIAIRGGSAGGWTTVAALVHSDVFAGGVAHYAITDPESWAAETHDFESRYLDGLIGPLPETRDRYTERSPLLRAAHASGPCLMLHGLEDAIVDVGQAERFVAELDRHGRRWALLTYPGEQHGWRREETIVSVLEAELAFYGLLFGFETPEVPPLKLEGRP